MKSALSVVDMLRLKANPYKFPKKKLTVIKGIYVHSEDNCGCNFHTPDHQLYSDTEVRIMTSLVVRC